MTGFASFSVVCLTAVFFVVDPLGAMPLFLALTQGDSPKQRRQAALKGTITAFVTLSLFAAAGDLIFRAFGITLGAFKIAGGILLFLLSLDMMRAQTSRVRTSPEEEAEGAEARDVGLVPLGIPLLAGPGAIATVMVLVSQAVSQGRIFVVPVFASIALTCFLAFWILRGSEWVEKRLKRTGMNALTRIMGLLLAAIAVQFAVSGIHDVLPTLLVK
jgi:multiple antibiotic resistance protein